MKPQIYYSPTLLSYNTKESFWNLKISFYSFFFRLVKVLGLFCVLLFFLYNTTFFLVAFCIIYSIILVYAFLYYLTRIVSNIYIFFLNNPEFFKAYYLTEDIPHIIVRIPDYNFWVYKHANSCWIFRPQWRLASSVAIQYNNYDGLWEEVVHLLELDEALVRFWCIYTCFFFFFAFDYNYYWHIYMAFDLKRILVH